jgi:phosphatidylglycerophosphate synthase
VLTDFSRKVFKSKIRSNNVKPKYLTIANYITVTRLIIALISFLFMILNKWLIAFFLIFIAIILDIVDGKVARGMKEVSKYGIFLDIMVDKIVIISTFLMIGIYITRIFFYLGILMLVREYIMDTMRSIAASNNKVIPADKLSKIKGVLFMTSMLIIIGNYVLISNTSNPAISAILQWIGIVMAVLGMIFAYFTLGRFLLIHRNVLE